MPDPHKPEQNQLLAALSASELGRLYPHLKLTPMPLADVLYESGSQLEHVYFPTDCIVSLLYLMKQMSQTAVCNRHHDVEQQLCRWLLLRLDRLSTSELITTQDLIATMLGVRREAVTEAAGKLQDAGLIRYARGHITVLDRPGLESKVCECYAVVKREYDRLLPSTAG
jgi:CRP-like cAMP-binding protein